MNSKLQSIEIRRAQPSSPSLFMFLKRKIYEDSKGKMRTWVAFEVFFFSFFTIQLTHLEIFWLNGGVDMSWRGYSLLCRWFISSRRNASSVGDLVFSALNRSNFSSYPCRSAHENSFSIVQGLQINRFNSSIPNKVCNKFLRQFFWPKVYNLRMLKFCFRNTSRNF